MADIANISGSNVAASPARSSSQVRSAASVSRLADGGRSNASKGYADADEVTRRASVLSEGETPQNQASLNRLDRVLSSSQPLRGDVPRGFYLDLRI